MAEDLHARLAQADRTYVDSILARVNSLTSDAKRESSDREALLTTMRQVLALVTDHMVLQLLREQLVYVTNESHQDFIAVAKPSINLLTFVPPKGDPDPEPDAFPRPIAGGDDGDEYDDVLEDTPGYDSYQIGKLVVVQNPYLQFEDLKLTATAIHDAKASGGRGGQLSFLTSEAPWAPGDAGIDFLPKPSDTGSKTWYFKTGMKPGSIPSTLPSGFDTTKLRNVVKTVEVVYENKLTPTGGIETGEFVKKTVDAGGSTPGTTEVIVPPGPGVVEGTTTTAIPGGTRTITITKRTKLAHVIILYAGGNGS